MRADTPSSGATLESADPSSSSPRESGTHRPSAAEIAEGSIVGAWRLERCVGEGAMGSVYEARHLQLGRVAALKVLKREHAANPALVQRFFAEARTVNTIDHPHIVQVHDFADGSATGGAVFLVMEMLRGESLASRLQRGPLPLAEALTISRQVAQALAAAHRVGVVHRDLKPDNIFLSQPPAEEASEPAPAPGTPVAIDVKVLDFGVAKLLTEPSTGLTLDGVLVGTPRYMSPEQAACLETDERTDIYGLGAVMFELLAGRAPFTDPALGTLMVEILTTPAPEVGERTASGEAIPASLQALLARCLAKLPGDRPASMGEVLEALNLSGARARVRWPFARSRKAVLAQAAVAGVLALLAAAVVLDRGELELVKRESVTLEVHSTPPGAQVLHAETGEALGTTPMNVRFSRASTELPVVVKLAGHVPARHEVSLARSVQLEVQLAPAAERSTAGAVIPASVVPTNSVRDAVVDPFTR